MTRAGRRNRPGGTLLVSVGLYVAVIFASPSLHLDYQCHVTSPRDCPACIANPPAPGAEPVGTLGAALLVDFGRAVAPLPTFPPSVDAARLPGRSPPL